MTDPDNSLKETVIANGFCIGCGACAAVPGSPMQMQMTADGQYEATRISDVKSAYELNATCPFSDQAPDEDELSRSLFANCQHHTHIGYSRALYAGHIIEGYYRREGSSGGFGSWIAVELLKRGLVDYVAHVREARTSNGILFEYAISSSSMEICSGAKSRYYPVHMAAVLSTIREKPGRYALIGLPCFVKAVRLLQRADHVFRDRILFCIALVCGHLKSARYAESLAWQMGVPPGSLHTIDFRVKDGDARANQYRVRVSDGTGTRTRAARELFGTDWGAGLFKYQACDFCDDLFAETADMVIGDAWLPNFVSDPLGTNIVISRREILSDILTEAECQGRIWLTSLAPSEIIASQAGGLRHRRDAITYRLAEEKAAKAWVPRKRFKPSRTMFPKYERVRQNLRSKLRNLSHESYRHARAQGDLQLYMQTMMPVYQRYKAVSGNLFERLVSAFRRRWRKIL